MSNTSDLARTHRTRYYYILDIYNYNQTLNVLFCRSSRAEKSQWKQESLENKN